VALKKNIRVVHCLLVELCRHQPGKQRSPRCGLISGSKACMHHTTATRHRRLQAQACLLLAPMDRAHAEACRSRRRWAQQSKQGDTAQMLNATSTAAASLLNGRPSRLQLASRLVWAQIGLQRAQQ
jgi:hypothetical protein